MAMEHATETSIEPGDSDPADFWRHAFEALVERFPEPAFGVDADGEIRYWNDGAEALTGYPASETVGMGAYEVFGTEGEEETLAETVVRTGEVIREEDLRTAAGPTGSGLTPARSAFPSRRRPARSSA